MFGFLSTVVVCATVLYIFTKYFTCYGAVDMLEPEKIQELDNTLNKDAANFDRIISEIYGRLDEYDKEMNDES